MYVYARDVTDHVLLAYMLGRRPMGARPAQGPLDDMVEDRDADIDEHQAGNDFIDAPVVAQHADAGDPKTARCHAGEQHGDLDRDRRLARQRQPRRDRAEAPDHEGTLVADDDEPQAGGDCGAECR